MKVVERFNDKEVFHTLCGHKAIDEKESIGTRIMKVVERFNDKEVFHTLCGHKAIDEKESIGKRI